MAQSHSDRIGFIGVGLMGHGMAKNIVEKGYGLTVMGRRNRAPIEDLVQRGAREAKTPKEIAQASDIVFLCVTGSPEVEAVVRGPDGLKHGLKQGSIVVDCSTSDPVSTMALAAELEGLGVTLVDAPLSRTPKEAWEGTLDTMVGASPEIFARLKPVLDTWAGRVLHIGGTGDGHRMKLLNNFLSMGYAALYSEALVLAQKVGITPDRFDSVIRNGRMDCAFYQTFMRFTLEGDRDAHKFTLSNAFKDMRYLESMADAAGIANPLGNAVKNAFALAVAAGGANDYVPMLAEAVANRNGASVVKKKASDVDR
jgi:3-hydroxyisobutyrate dehydrogenase-like beta-hydroxyacid dehydrogenase